MTSVFILFCLIAGAASLDLSPIHDDLNKALNAAIDQFFADVQKMTIPDYHDSSGRVSYSITNNHVTSVTRGSANIDIKTPGQVSLSLAGFGLSAAGNWRYKYKKGFIKIRDSGRYSGSAGGIRISTTIALAINNGKVTLTQTACDADVSGLNLKLKGGLSWIYNIFVKKAVKKYRGQLGGIMCEKLKKVVERSADKIPPLPSIPQ